MKLSILDQSPVRVGGEPRQALQETLELAQIAEQLGYHRFWVSEHHNTTSLAGSAPEVLLAAIGAHTGSIRIGSGGVMLPHYSAFKVAETFSLLTTLYPGRVDLGSVGRRVRIWRPRACWQPMGAPNLNSFLRWSKICADFSITARTGPA